MYKYPLIFISLFYVLSLNAQNRADSIRQRIESLDTKYVLVVSHRADWRYAAENSMMAIENAMKLGVDIIELDVQRTKDGHLVLMHDETLDRTTTGKGRVDSITLESLKNLKLRNGIGIRTSETVPTLEEVLVKTKGRVLLNLDKADRYIDEVYALMHKTGTTKYIVMKTNKSFIDTRVQFHEYLLHTFIMPIIDLNEGYAESEIDAFMSFLRPKMFELVYKDASNPSPRLMKQKLKGKSLLWYNTMWDTLAGGNDDDKALEDPDAAYGYLIDTLGANIIQTDRPEYLLEYLRKRGLHN